MNDDLRLHGLLGGGKKPEGDAVAADVLAGKTFSNDDDTGIEGTMVGRGSIEVTPSDAVQNFDDGYYVGITVLPRPVLTGDADAAHVLAGKKFYSNNYTQKIGTMIDRAGDTTALALTRSGTTIKLRATAGFRDGTNDFVTHSDANDVSSNVKKDVNIRGTLGTLEPKQYATGTVAMTSTSWGGIIYNKATVSGLAFEPKIVALSRSDFSGSSYMCKQPGRTLGQSYGVAHIIPGNPIGLTQGGDGVAQNNLTSSGFSVVFAVGSTYVGNITWEAWG